MTLPELSRLVALGEGAHLEFKRKVPEPIRIAKEVIAFANAHGGKLLIGIDDDGSIVGLRDFGEEVYELERSLKAHCEPPIAYEIEVVPFKHRRDIVVVHIPDSAQKPHFLINHNGQRARIPYIRVKDMSIEASREVVRVIRGKKNPKDVQFVFGEKEHTLMQYLDRYEKITVSQFAKLVDIPKRLASHTLVLLTKAEILALHPNETSDYFTLAK